MRLLRQKQFWENAAVVIGLALLIALFLADVLIQTPNGELLGP